MLVLGLILVVLAAAAVVAALVGGSDQASIDLGGVTVETTTAGVFLAGAVTLVVLVVGLGLVRAGARRAQQHRRDRRELNRLSKKLEHQESDTAATTATAAGSKTADSGENPSRRDSKSDAGATPAESTGARGDESAGEADPDSRTRQGD